MMIYYCDQEITVCSLRYEDAKTIAEKEVAQGWIHASPEKYLQRLQDQQSGKAAALAAEYCGQVAGYISVYFQPEQGAFAHQGIPEIVDFGVLEKFRRRGIGSKLMDVAEQVPPQLFLLLSQTVSYAVEAMEEAGQREIVTAGAKELLKLPEFRDADKAHQLMSFLTDSKENLPMPEEGPS